MRLRSGCIAVLALSTVVVAGCTSSNTSTTASNAASGSITILVAADGGQNYDPQTNAAPSST
jgi:ABC-type glycerol-3-phosphate transport system substrate-binding protein